MPAGGQSTVQISFQPPRRGLHPVPLIRAETRFPLGTFRVWTVWRPASQILVYPKPEAMPPPLPPGEPRAGTGVAGNAREATDNLGDLRSDVEASLRKIDALITDLNRKWPFAPKDKEVKLP